MICRAGTGVMSVYECVSSPRGASANGPVHGSPHVASRVHVQSAGRAFSVPESPKFSY